MDKKAYYDKCVKRAVKTINNGIVLDDLFHHVATSEEDVKVFREVLDENGIDTLYVIADWSGWIQHFKYMQMVAIYPLNVDKVEWTDEWGETHIKDAVVFKKY